MPEETEQEASNDSKNSKEIFVFANVFPNLIDVKNGATILGGYVDIWCAFFSVSNRNIIKLSVWLAVNVDRERIFFSRL